MVRILKVAFIAVLAISVSACDVKIAESDGVVRVTVTDTSKSLNPTVTKPTATASPTSSTNTPLPDNLGLKPIAQDGVQKIVNATGFKGTILGKGSRPNNLRSDHPKGMAADFMISSKEEGDRIADYARENKDELNVKYVLWQSRDHYDHVHVSFEEN